MERLANQLGQVLDYIRAPRHEGHPSIVEEAEALHTLKSGKVVDNGVGLQAQGDATNEKESINQEVLHQPHQVEKRAATGVVHSTEKQRDNVQKEKREELEKSKEDARVRVNGEDDINKRGVRKGYW